MKTIKIMTTTILIASFSILSSARVYAQTEKSYSDTEVKKMASDKFKEGILPLGDKKYVTDGPKKGFIYLCNVRSAESEGGAQKAGSWINESDGTWNINKKISVLGSVAWKNAQFKMATEDGERVFNGNNLPINHNTGTFPVTSNDPAYQIDRNPNSIQEQTLSLSVPENPEFGDEPSCTSGEVGIANSGAMIYNGFDALNRDAVAREIQDSCSGHPQREGQYHYHGISSCFKDILSNVCSYVSIFLSSICVA